MRTSTVALAITVALAGAAGAPAAVARDGVMAGSPADSGARGPVASAAEARLEESRRTGLTDTRLHGLDIDRATIPQLHRQMRRGRLTSRELTGFYLARIRRVDPLLHSVLQVNPDALQQATASDARRRRGLRVRPLEGIPVVLKDNVDTRRMRTTAGSLALAHSRPATDAFLVQRLRRAGAVVLGKTNLSEWANFRGFQSSSGWSAVGGQNAMPYVLDRNPCGSSSGSAVAVAATLAQAAVGTETDGSIVCPAGANGVVGVKPSLGLVSRSGVVPISTKQDTAGPMARNVTDAAVTLSALTGVDPRDPATKASRGHTSKYQTGLGGSLRGARIGVWRAGVTGASPEADGVFEAALARLRTLGATVVEGADPPGLDAVNQAEFPALLCEFKHDVNAYLAARPGRHPRDLTGLVTFNEANAARELKWFGQEIFEAAEATSGDLQDPACAGPRRTATSGARASLDTTIARLRLDAVVAITNGPAWTTDLVNGDQFLTGSSTPAAVAGYPSVTVPAGYTHGLPIGVSLMSTKWQERRLLQLAAAWERRTRVRVPPRYLPSITDQAAAAPRGPEPRASLRTPW